MKIKITIVCLFIISLLVPLYALVPINAQKNSSNIKTTASKIIEKTFVAIDRYDHVELGELEDNVHVFIYNSNGELAEMRDIDKDGNFVVSYIIEYDKSGEKISEKKYDKNSNLAGYSIFTYAKSKQVKQEDVFSETGELSYSFIFEYDKNGNMVLRKRVGANKEEGISVLYEYNATRQLSGERTSNKTGNVISSKQFAYNAKGLLSEEKRLDKDGAVRIVITYVYDENGNKIQMTTSQKNGNSVLANIRYEFDKKGNWIKQIIFRNEVIPIRVITREITY
jgi:hypothetical protein